MRLILLLSVMVMASMISQPQYAAQDSAGASAPAVLLGFEREGGTLHFDVVSTGCTQAKHFMLQFNESEPGAKVRSATLLRVKPDRCRRKPMKIRISLDASAELLDAATLTLTNAFAAKPSASTSES